MNMHETEQILKNIQYKAPVNFTRDVMTKIHTCNESRQTAKHIARMGTSLVAAGLIVLLLSLTPLMDFLIEKGTDRIAFPGDSIDPYRTSDSIEYYTLKADSILLKPFRFITNHINKEDVYYDRPN